MPGGRVLLAPVRQPKREEAALRDPVGAVG
jgi:hypothetical protein